MSLVGLRVVPVGSIVGRKPWVVGETGLAHRLPQPPSRKRAQRSPLPLPTPQERTGRGSAGCPLRSAARCGRSAAARGQRDSPAAPLVEESSVPVGWITRLAPPPPQLWCLSPGPVGRRAGLAPSLSGRTSDGGLSSAASQPRAEPALPPPPCGATITFSHG